MSFRLEIISRKLHFKQPAGTSRGVYRVRDVWYVKATDIKTGALGYGECAPLFDLSCDYTPDYQQILVDICKQIEQQGYINYEQMRSYPSMLFGIETALRQMERQSWILWDSPFARGERGIPINGLVWMGNYKEMLSRLEEKMEAGFRCVKLKIGAIDFESEISLIKHIRNRYSRKEIELRVDANGAFDLLDVNDKLERLSAFDIHSIEQPIKAGQWQQMAKLCQSTPIPIALDEELIGVNNLDDKKTLLDTIKPQYIILKPSLHGGISGAEEWISLATERKIGYWVTSALESNIGLNAIAQWCATLNPQMPQGLGTGMLFTDNIDLPLYIEGDKIFVSDKLSNSEIKL